MRSTVPARVLLVEDSAADAQLIRRLLREIDPEASIRHHVRLDEALAVVRDGAFDLGFVDLGLPDSNGTDTVRRLHSASPDLPLVVLTGQDDEPTGIRCIELGATDYLDKASMDERAVERAWTMALARRRQAEADGLRDALDLLRAIQAAGPRRDEAPVGERDDEVSGLIRARYRRTLDAVAAEMSGRGPKADAEIDALVGSFAALDAGGRDLLAVHVDVAVAAMAEPDGERHAAAAQRLALEAVGRLLELYRSRAHRPAPSPEDRP